MSGGDSEIKLNEDFEGIDEDLLVDDDASLFWSMTITPKDSHDIQPPEIPDFIIHITNACFGATVQKGSRTVLFCEREGQKIPLCVLTQGRHENHSLDLLINESLSLSVKGQKPSAITITGYAQPNIMAGMDMNADIEDNAELMEYMRQQQLRSAQLGGYDDMEDEADDERTPQLMNEAPKEDGDDSAEDAEDSDSEDLPQSSRITTQMPPHKKRKLTQNKSEGKMSATTASHTNSISHAKKTASQRKKSKTSVNLNTTATHSTDTTPKGASPKAPELPPPIVESSDKANAVAVDDKAAKKKKKKSKKDKSMKTMKGGIRWRDMKVGKGQPAKNGKTVKMFYVGQLDNGTVFDKCISGDGFEFVLGNGDVIKGWDLGIKGMKVGSKRRLVIPSKMAYGTDGMPPKIPANARLTFTVELKAIE